MESRFDQPYGEVPGWVINYHLFLVRRGDSRMLWLGIPFRQSEELYRIYDAIPLPPTEPGDVLIPFTCTRNMENDIFLVVIAACPEEGSATDIRYAWRIDPESTSLESMSTTGIACSPDW